jgi:hypothetical protein
MKSVYLITMIVFAGVVLSVSVCAPAVLADNEFLKGFINHEILSILAVIMTISIATIGTIHIWFNELEAKHEKKVFMRARNEINQNAGLFIILFLAELGILVVRGYFSGNQVAISLFNGFSLLVLLCSVLTLADVIRVVRALTPGE